MESIGFIWFVSALILGIFACYACGSATGKYLGILIDSRGRFSLTHFQVVAWTILILSAFAATLIVAVFDIAKIKLSNDLLGLMEIAAGSAVISTAVKSVKDAPDSTAKIARDGAGAAPVVPAAPAPVYRPKFSRLWLEEEGEFADKVVSITKFQNFIFTLVALATFISLAVKTGSLPQALPENFLVLLGISHAGYMEGKIPDKK
jgi:hypothetical protein